MLLGSVMHNTDEYLGKTKLSDIKKCIDKMHETGSLNDNDVEWWDDFWKWRLERMEFWRNAKRVNQTPVGSDKTSMYHYIFQLYNTTTQKERICVNFADCDVCIFVVNVNITRRENFAKNLLVLLSIAVRCACVWRL